MQTNNISSAHQLIQSGLHALKLNLTSACSQDALRLYFSHLPMPNKPIPRKVMDSQFMSICDVAAEYLIHICYATYVS